MLPEPELADASGTPQRKQTSPSLGQKDEVTADVPRASRKGHVSREVYHGIEGHSHNAAVEANSVPTVDFILDRDLFWMLIAEKQSRWSIPQGGQVHGHICAQMGGASCNTVRPISKR